MNIIEEATIKSITKKKKPVISMDIDKQHTMKLRGKYYVAVPLIDEQDKQIGEHIIYHYLDLEYKKDTPLLEKLVKEEIPIGKYNEKTKKMTLYDEDWWIENQSKWISQYGLAKKRLETLGTRTFDKPDKIKLKL